MKIALVHDFLREFGGAERVLEVLHEMFPDAPIYTAYYNSEKLGPHKERIEKWDIRTSFIQKLPFASKLISPLRIIAAKAFESFDLSEYDLVISSTDTYFSKAVITKKETLNICYMHTPPRYLYGYATSYNYKKRWWTRIGAEIMNHFLRVVDYQISQRPDILIANSKNVAQRIKKFYRRESVVIYPPVEVEQFKKSSKKEGGYYLCLNRLVRSMGTEVIIQACTKLNLPLKVVGSGPELERLKNIAGKSVEFLGHVSDEQRVELYANAKAFITATENVDFGITAIESQATGTPVIAARNGGYLETIIKGKTGEFFEQGNIELLINILENFNPAKYKKDDLRKNAEKYSKERFKRELMALINKNFKG